MKVIGIYTFMKPSMKLPMLDYFASQINSTGGLENIYPSYINLTQ